MCYKRIQELFVKNSKHAMEKCLRVCTTLIHTATALSLLLFNFNNLTSASLISLKYKFKKKKQNFNERIIQLIHNL